MYSYKKKEPIDSRWSPESVFRMGPKRRAGLYYVYDTIHTYIYIYI